MALGPRDLGVFKTDRQEEDPNSVILCTSNGLNYGLIPIGSMYGIYANIGGILMGSMLPYIAYMDPMGYAGYGLIRNDRLWGFEVLRPFLLRSDERSQAGGLDMIWYILWWRELLGKKGGNTHFLTSVASASCYSLHNKVKSIILDAVSTPLTWHVTILWCPDDCPAEGLGGLSVCLSVRWERKVDFGLICLEASNYIIIHHCITLYRPIRSWTSLVCRPRKCLGL